MRWVLIVLAIAFAASSVIVVLAQSKPTTISISRSINVRAPPAAVFDLINDFHHWPRWAPQDVGDPTMVRRYEGPSSGKGAVSTWSGSGQTGAGRMEITRSEPNSAIEVTVDFQRPFTAHNVNTFHIAQMSNGNSRVTWSMTGTNVLMMKLMSVFVSPDRMIGVHFEAGLASLKAVAEAEESVPAGAR